MAQDDLVARVFAQTLQSMLLVAQVRAGGRAGRIQCPADPGGGCLGLLQGHLQQSRAHGPVADRTGGPAALPQREPAVDRPGRPDRPDRRQERFGKRSRAAAPAVLGAARRHARPGRRPRHPWAAGAGGQLRLRGGAAGGGGGMEKVPRRDGPGPYQLRSVSGAADAAAGPPGPPL